MDTPLLPDCPHCHNSGWSVPYYYVCDCRHGDYAWAKWEGMTIEEYDARAIGTSDYHGADVEAAL